MNKPNDRELLLRAKINRGWSSHRQLSTSGVRARKDTISEDEMQIVQQVVRRGEELQRHEMSRVEKLATTFENMRGKDIGK